MLSAICQELKNWFTDDNDKHIGRFTISDGEITSLNDLEIQEGQYYRIVGSVFNDGVYQYPNTDLTDETFTGAVWLMSIPKDIIDLSNDINEWMTNNASTLNSPYQSESFGGYSYTKANSSTGASLSWQDQFSQRLNRWRKIR